MNVDVNTESVKADDIEHFSSVSTKHNKNAREVEEVLLEIKTICNDKVTSNCEFINSTTSEHSSYTPEKSNKSFLSDNSEVHSDFDYHSISPLLELKPSNEDNLSLNENLSSNINTACLEQNINSVLPCHCSISNIKDDFHLTHQNSEHVGESDNSDKVKDFNEQEFHQESSSNESSESLDDARRALRRNTKRKKEYEGCCPVCGVTVRLNDLSSHYSQEVERLSKIQKTLKRPRHEEIFKNEAFEQVKSNRENRLTARVATYSDRAKNEVKCPVCSLRMSGTEEEINKHVAYCIQEEDSDEMVVVDDEDDDDHSFEEYQFGDQRRIRTISLVEGGYRSLQGPSCSIIAVEEDLNVDVDDTFAYGQPHNAKCEKDRNEVFRLRKAVVGNTSVQPNIVEGRKWHMINEREYLREEPEEVPDEPKNTDSNVIVSSLKEKIKDLEDQNQNVKCLICLEPYTKPLVSTTCWHVHCEECWLMTMGVKKLCPQCNMIVFPSDLRKIYL